eukprot:2419141-Rhodomonas_salina.2
MSTFGSVHRPNAYAPTAWAIAASTAVQMGVEERHFSKLLARLPEPGLLLTLAEVFPHQVFPSRSQTFLAAPGPHSSKRVQKDDADV